MPEQLDDRIRSLVAAAVADAPAPPDLDASTAPINATRPAWVRRGVIALAGLLAVGGGYAALQPASNDHDVDTGQHTTTTVPAPAPPLPPVIVTAGPHGITETIEGDTRKITNEPFAMALALDDGTFVAQRHSGESHQDGVTWPKSDTSVLHIDNDGHTATLFEARSGFVILHDFAVVDGRRTLLYSVDVNGYTNSNEELYALDLDSDGGPIDVGSIGGWEAETSRLTLGSNGLIVGTSFGVCCSSGNFLAMVIPGSPAAAHPLPKASDFGLQDGYEDGCVCPTAFAINSKGTALYWVSPVLDGAKVVVVRAPLDNPSEQAEVTAIGDPTRMSIDPSDARVVVTYGDANSGVTRSPDVFASDTSSNLNGDIATLGPND